MEIIEGLVIGTVMGYILLFCMIGGVLSVLPTILLGAFYVLMAIIAVVSFIALATSEYEGSKIGKGAAVVFLALSLGGIFCMANRGSIAAVSESAAIANAKSFLSIENKCPDEEITGVQIRYEEAEDWIEAWPAKHGDNRLDHVPLKENDKKFSLLITTKNSKNHKKYVIFFARQLIDPQGEPTIYVSYNGSRLLIHNDAVTISDTPQFNCNTIVFYQTRSVHNLYFEEMDSESADPKQFVKRFLITDKYPGNFLNKDRIPVNVKMADIKQGSKIRITYSCNGQMHKTQKTFTAGAMNYIEVSDNGVQISQRPIPCKFSYKDYDDSIEYKSL